MEVIVALARALGASFPAKSTRSRAFSSSRSNAPAYLTMKMTETISVAMATVGAR